MFCLGGIAGCFIGYSGSCDHPCKCGETHTGECVVDPERLQKAIKKARAELKAGERTKKAIEERKAGKIIYPGRKKK